MRVGLNECADLIIAALALLLRAIGVARRFGAEAGELYRHDHISAPGDDVDLWGVGQPPTPRM